MPVVAQAGERAWLACGASCRAAGFASPPALRLAQNWPRAADITAAITRLRAPVRLISREQS